MSGDIQKILLITGFPLITSRRLIVHIAQKQKYYIAMLVPPKFERAARSFIEGNHLKTNVRIVIGDIATMHLGFSSEEYRFLLKNVTDIYHLAAIYYPDTSEEIIKRVNISGVRNIIQFVKDAEKIIPINYLSTCMVFENHSGLIPEEPVRRSKYSCFLYKSRSIAESIITSESNLNWRIFRAPLIGGDSLTGETEKLDGFYALLYLLLLTDMKIPIPIPNNGRAPLNIIPIDYLIKVLYHISLKEESINKFFHIIDPHPVSIRNALELISRHTSKKMRIFFPPVDILKPISKANFLKRIIPQYIPLIDILNQFTIFSHTNTDKFIKDLDIEPPHFEDYLKPMIAFVKEKIEQGKKDEILTEDPLGE